MSSRAGNGADTEDLITFTNIKQGEVVHQRLLLIVGRAGSPNEAVRSITAHPDPRSRFASIPWQVNQSHFKASVPLREGENVIRFVGQLDGSRSTEVKLTIINEFLDVPPLRIGILVAKDNPLKFDEQPTPTSDQQGADRATSTHRPFPEPTKPPVSDGKPVYPDSDASATQIEPTKTSDDARPLIDCPPGPIRDKLLQGGIGEIIKRVAIQTYAWQAFYAEQMHRQRFGRRTFRLEEHPVPEGDQEVRLEDLLVVHLLRSDKTTAEFHDADNTQQNPTAKNSGAMWHWAHDAVAKDPLLNKSRAPTAVLLLESHWVPDHPQAPRQEPKQKQRGLILAHAALGGQGGAPWMACLEAQKDRGQTQPISLGVMGSHWVWAAPSSLDQLTKACLDETRTDEKYTVSDHGETGTAWETFCVGMGAWLHEAGHAFGNPHWPTGIMNRGYNEFSRIFMTTEAFRTRANAPGERLITPANDDINCHLHRAEACRARWHPCFQLPSDQPAAPKFIASDPASARAWEEWASLPPRIYASPEGAIFDAPDGGAIAAIEIDVVDELAMLMTFTGRPAGDGAMPGPEPMTDFVLTKSIVEECLKNRLQQFNPDLLARLLGPNKPAVMPKVLVRVVGTNLTIATLEDYYRDAFSWPMQIFAVRNGDIVDPDRPPGPGILAVRAPGVGREVFDVMKLCSKCEKRKIPHQSRGSDHEEDDDDGGNESDSSVKSEDGYTRGLRSRFAFASEVGDQPPRLTSIDIDGGDSVEGVRFNYSDGTYQLQGRGADIETNDRTRRFEVAPEDGHIAKIIVRAGWWLDAIQFVFESGKMTDMVGSQTDGELHVLVPPRGHRIVGTHGSLNQWIRSFGIYYSVDKTG
ncbi:hypothetical protein OC846_003147 [Tilletia horrida]|uniref:Jacalin-type lectin domain-containing protein n=1 Tax=Tilletia horrida TaxID=155126 RepID=A0AAN6GQH8_9BASI|nr:hypothetical protein OC845_004166 [Tilletia horrida]KAK0551762.1 hypothetical protein OC846_003147 [Tilletia horrida]